MKKVILLLVLLISLSGCKKDSVVQDEDSNIGIVVPTGAPSLAFINEIDNPDFETNSVANNVLAMMNENSDKSVVVIDTVSGLKAIQNGAPYKLAANITFGNFFIAATGNDDNKQMDKDDRIVLFGKNITPDIVFHFVYGNAYDDKLEYVDSVSDAGKVLAAGKNFETMNDVDYVFIAEPVLSKILNNEAAATYGKAYVYKNVQDDYEAKTGSEMIQASLFIKDDDSIVDKDAYLEKLKDNIDNILRDEEYASEYIADKSDEEVSTKYGVDTKTLDDILDSNSVGLGFKYAYDNKEAIDNFVALFGVEKTYEDIYYQ